LFGFGDARQHERAAVFFDKFANGRDGVQRAHSFSADAVTTAKFGLEASSAGTVKTAGPLTLTAGTTTTTNFTFP